MKRLPLVLLLPLFLLGSCNYTSERVEVKADLNNNAERSRKPQNIILMIGDGMGLTQITAGMIANNNELQLERFSYIGLCKTSSSDALVTDSAAGATALSTGEKTYNGAIGVDDNKTALETILEIAANHNYSTGLIATSSITHATPASFYAHQPSRAMDEAIAMDMLKAPVDLFMGGGRDFFENREDKLNLLDSLQDKGFRIYDNVAGVPTSGSEKVACFIAAQQPKGILEGRGDFLPDATAKAVSLLDKENGFFMMVEGSQIDWAGHSNDSEGVIAEMKDFNNAIEVVMDFAKKDGNTLVIVTADHETGGYAIIDGNKKDATVEGDFITDHHTGTMVPVFAYGPGAETFAGIYENTAIFDKMLNLLKK